MMELVCEKYKEKMAATAACCRHPAGYCKFRSSCVIWFLAGEKAGDNDSAPQGETDNQAEKAAADR
jgi:hypothetical protein